MPAHPTRNLLAFLLLCLFWGLTWVAIKLAVVQVPPILFAALRFLAAGLVLLVLGRRALVAARGHWGRLTLAALLINTGCYALLFWGMVRVSSGLSAVINLAIIPLGLFLIGLALGEERYSRRKLLGVLVGMAGLGLLFWPRLTAAAAPGDEATLLGMAALVAGTLCYCLGSVLSRPLLRAVPPLTLSGLHNFLGGLGLLALSLLLEPLGEVRLATLLRPEVFWSWLYLVALGSIVSFTIYLNLIRDWGPTRAGLYCFVSPVVAIAVGLVVFAEPFGPYEIAGSLVMLAAAAIALTERPGSLRGASAVAPRHAD